MELSRRDVLIASGAGIVGWSAAYKAIEIQSGRTDQEPSQNKDINLQLNNRPLLGNSDSDIIIVYWSDYQCPFCARFEQNTLPKLQSQYINTGEANLIMKPVDFFGQDSQNSALSIHCVINQLEKPSRLIWDWHTLLHSKYTGDRNTGWATPQKLGDYATRSEFNSIDSDELVSCVQNKTHMDKIQLDTQEGKDLGLQGTPFFLFLNTQTGSWETLSGAQPFGKFETAIDSIKE